MNITVRISVDIERADGTSTEITETAETHDGDNPAFELQAVRDAIGAVVGIVNRRVAFGQGPA